MKTTLIIIAIVIAILVSVVGWTLLRINYRKDEDRPEDEEQ